MPRVLVVDDDPIIAQMLATAIRRAVGGAECTIAGNGAVAMDAVLHNGSWDLILCDVMMPVMDGLRFVEALDALPEPHPRVLMLSAVDPQQAAPSLPPRTVVGYLQKPVDLQVLVERVRGLLAA